MGELSTLSTEKCTAAGYPHLIDRISKGLRTALSTRQRSHLLDPRDELCEDLSELVVRFLLRLDLVIADDLVKCTHSKYLLI